MSIMKLWIHRPLPPWQGLLIILAIILSIVLISLGFNICPIYP